MRKASHGDEGKTRWTGRQDRTGTLGTFDFAARLLEAKLVGQLGGQPGMKRVDGWDARSWLACLTRCPPARPSFTRGPGAANACVSTYRTLPIRTKSSKCQPVAHIAT